MSKDISHKINCNVILGKSEKENVFGTKKERERESGCVWFRDRDRDREIVKERGHYIQISLI